MKVATLLLFLFTVYGTHAQDIITKKNGEIIPARVMEVNQSEIKFKRQDDLNGPLYVIPKSDVAVIQYADSRNDIFDHSEELKAKTRVHDSLYLKGQIDAFKFYHKYQNAGTVTLVSSLITPFGGLVPAIVFSEIPPKPQNLNCPNIELLTSNVSYYRGYTDRARKIKNGKVWKNWFIGFGVNVIAYVIIVTRP